MPSEQKGVTLRQLMRSIVLIHLILLVLAVGISWFLAPPKTVAAIVAGGALGLANLALLAWLCHKSVSAQQGQWRWLAIMGLKFLLLIAMVFAAICWLHLDVLGFLIGLGIAGIAIVAATTWMAMCKLELDL